MRHIARLAFAAAALGAFTGAGHAQDTLRIGTEGAYPPFNFIDSAGKLGGFDVEIAQALCDEMEPTSSSIRPPKSTSSTSRAAASTR